MPDEYEIRQMRRDELDLAVEWAALEGWNPGWGDAEAFYAADPCGFWIGLLDGEAIASISAVAYGAAFAFVGYYIVRPEYRGRGFGLRLWQRALARVAGRNIGLDGVLAQQANYERSGFSAAYHNVRYEGVTEPAPAVPGSSIVAAAGIDFDRLLTLDRQHFTADRTDFLRRWLQMPDSVALASVRGPELQGYGVVRRSRSGYRLGPLFASSEEAANELYVALSASVAPSQPLFLDVPDVNEAALRLAGRHGMQPGFETVRMYTLEPPPIPLASVYGVTSLELG